MPATPDVSGREQRAWEKERQFRQVLYEKVVAVPAECFLH